MKLKNKKTGETIDVVVNPTDFNTIHLCRVNTVKSLQAVNTWEYNSLAELYAEWEDCEEPEDDATRVITSFIHYVEEADDSFCCDESVKKLVEKLKAWRRLKDKGFKITGWDNSIGDDYYKSAQIMIRLNGDPDWDEYDNINDIKEDLDLLFGGEE